MYPSLRTAFLAAFLALAGCASERAPYNDLVSGIVPDRGYRLDNVRTRMGDHGLMVLLYFSGGGTRAASLAYGVLEELARTPVKTEGSPGRLLDHVALISAVSGGSYAAAYYGLFGERIFTDFEAKFLKRDVHGEINDTMYSLGNLMRITSPWFGRADVAAEYLDREIFQGRTYADLLAAGQRERLPFININATDMTIGARFEFTQDSFDRICANLQSLPVARAVAASSAVPVIVSPVTLKSYAGTCGYQEQPWVAEALRNRAKDVRRYYIASDERSYLSGRRPYIHLLDGGLADNLGLRAFVDRLVVNEGAVGASQASPVSEAFNKVTRLVHVVVNAQTRGDMEGIDRRAEVPTLAQVAFAVGLTTDRYSIETIAMMRSNLGAWTGQIRAERAKRSARPLPFEQYFVEVNFDAIYGEAERDYFNALPTALALPPEAVDRLRDVAGRLMREAPDYQRLLKELN